MTIRVFALCALTLCACPSPSPSPQAADPAPTQTTGESAPAPVSPSEVQEPPAVESTSMAQVSEPSTGG